jgi:hypothetical protein
VSKPAFGQDNARAATASPGLELDQVWKEFIEALFPVLRLSQSDVAAALAALCGDGGLGDAGGDEELVQDIFARRWADELFFIICFHEAGSGDVGLGLEVEEIIYVLAGFHEVCCGPHHDWLLRFLGGNLLDSDDLLHGLGAGGREDLHLLLLSLLQPVPVAVRHVQKRQQADTAVIIAAAFC